MVYISRNMLRLLSPLYFLYKSGGQIKSTLYKRHLLRSKQAPLLTISVGNISFGGSNKTPLSMNLLAFLKKQGYKPALVSRGYKGKWEHRGETLSDGKNIFGSWKDAGDEPYMVAKNFPEIGVFIGKSRLFSCQKAKNIGFDIAVLDDGFQHQKLKRDLDLVLFDPREKTALREPLASLNRAHFILVEKSLYSQSKNHVQEMAPGTQIFSYSVFCMGLFNLKSNNSELLSQAQDKKVLALSGIARPERFVTLLKEQGIKCCSSLKFPDHFDYPKSSIKKIVEVYNRHEADMIITTEKDSVKLQGIKDFKGIPVYYLKIDLKIEDNFYKNILMSLSKIQNHA
ncbi:MAG: tetraacyldisaccharide 4'-kinase [Candidatus Aminicenantes bacterium]|nr:tetraacyldisaccharide 4'-kinase [Candidatus Aminicenantes bacterium]